MKGLYALNESLSPAIKVFEKYRHLYDSIDVKASVARKDDCWYNVRTRILLNYSKKAKTTRRLVDTGNFVIISQTIKANRFNQLIKNLSSERIEIGGLKIRFLEEGGKLNLQLNRNYIGNSQLCKERLGVDWPTYAFHHRTQFKLGSYYSEEITPRLKCHNPAYEDIFEAVNEVVGRLEWGFQPNYADESSCYILMPNYVAFGECNLNGNVLDVNVKFHEVLDVSTLCLNLIHKGKETKRSQVWFDEGSIESAGRYNTAHKRITIKDAALVQLYLFVEGRNKDGVADERSVINRRMSLNPRLVAHEAFDMDSRFLKELLQGESGNPHDFEYGVAVLLHTLGFLTEWTGYKGPKPDLLAFCPESESWIVGECTTGIFDWRKLKALKDRATKVANAVKESTYPVMFTSLKLGDLEQGVITKALTEGIIIIPSKEIQNLFEMSLRGTGSKDAFDQYLKYAASL